MAAPAPDIAQTIQLSLAPAFLLTGIVGLLKLLTHRLADVVARAREIERHFTPAQHPGHARQVQELRYIDRRIAIGGAALLVVTCSATLICATVAGLFVGKLIGFSFARAMAFLFAIAMLLLIAGLVLFLVEVRIATRHIDIRDELLELGDRAG